MARVSARARLRELWLAVWHYITSAPLTFIWLLLLTTTTLVGHFWLTGRHLRMVLLLHSTNIHALATDPLGVLVSSLWWINVNNLESYPLLFTLFLAPAERWLGQLRWLSVGLSAHVLATYFSEGLLYVAIELRDASERYVRASDIGVSYFLVGVMGVLTYHVARPWRWGYLGVLLLVFGFPLLTMDRIELSFTAIGHFVAILVGLAFYPMARDRAGLSLSPARLKALYRRSRSPESSA